MARNNPEAVDLKELDRASHAEGDSQADLSRQAWDGMKASQKDAGASGQDGPEPGKDNSKAAADAHRVETNERGGVIARDEHGRITRVDYPDGVTYEYSRFDGNGQPTVMKITDHKAGDFGQWKKEGDGLWRSYNKDKPNYEVLVGEWRVDKQGVMRMDGVQDTRPLPGKDNKGYTEQASPAVSRDSQGRITRVDQPNGVTYQYSGFDQSGQPTSIKITQRGSKDFGEWKKERDGLWRAYHNGKPTSEVIVGEWLVNEKGELRHTGHQDMQPVSRPADSSRQPVKESQPPARDAAQPAKDRQPPAGDRTPQAADGGKQPIEAPRLETNERGGVIARDGQGRITRVDYPDGVTYEYSKFDGNGQPTVMKITDHKSGDFGQWKKEGDRLWRSYHKDKPNYEVLVGEWRVDQQGIMRMDGVQDSRPLPGPDNKGYTEQPSTKITRDGQGRISTVEQPNGVKYEYRNFDENGQPTSIKITQRGSKDFGEWKKERDGLWRAYHNGKPTSEVIVGEWLVNEKGELRHTGHQDMQPVQKTERASHAVRDTARSGDRTAEPKAKPEELKKEEFPDGHVVKRRADGRIAEVAYPPGADGKVKTRSFRYDDKGELSEVRESDGSRWTRQPDGKFQVRLPDGTKGAAFDKVSLDDKGNFVYEFKDLQLKFTHNADGTSMTEDGKAGTAVKFDSKSRAVETTGKIGTRKFEYNDKNELTAITHPDGTKYVKNGPDSWKEFGKDGKETGKTWKGKVEPDMIGGYYYQEAGKSERIHEWPDGTKFVEKDGASVELGPDRKVKSVTHPNGQSSEFKYGADGNLTEVKVPDGTVYKTTDGKTWTNSKTGESFQAKVEVVQPDGWYKIERNGKKTTMWTDGSISQEDLATRKYSLLLQNGTTRIFNDGQTATPARVITPQGRQVVFAADGSESSYEVRGGDTLGEIARDLLIANNTLDQNYKPTDKEVDEAIDLLVKTNSIANRNRIERGQKLTIPKQLAS
ncbi:MAG TPA: LysM domain-containing protein [Candidatus Obscuribacterales bacterium]